MNQKIILILTILVYPIVMNGGEVELLKREELNKVQLVTNTQVPIGRSGLTATYRNESGDDIPGSVVKTLKLAIGPLNEQNNTRYQWLHLRATKVNGEEFNVWILTDRYPSTNLKIAQKTIVRYIFQEGNSKPLEFRHQFSGDAVLPSLGRWEYLFPQAINNISSEGVFAKKIKYLGHKYLLEKIEDSPQVIQPDDITLIELLPDVLIGVPHNTKQKDQTRRYDDSDYELIRLTKEDYDEMIESGMNCLRVDKEQASWIAGRNVFYWGIGGEQVDYPECLYRSNYLGPLLFMDEPAVCTRDHVIRPRLRKDQEFRKAITPQIVLEEFQKYFHNAKYQGNPTALLRGLSTRPDVDLGDMEFLQQNLYTWETMVSSALYQLGEGNSTPPSSMVFEPPGRVGTLRTLPEMNMAYLCQIPVENPKNLTGIIYGFLRGAARLTNKGWGTSIYGQVDRADSFWFLTHAYDLGASLFFFWDTHRLACVPYNECLALARNLRAHVEAHPYREMNELIRAAEIAILLPPGYNLGHVYLGKGNLWGLGELNLERINREGVKYRTIMSNFFTEIERCIRMGVEYDLFWDLEGYDFHGYREVVHIREDGKVTVEVNGKKILHNRARTPDRPEGKSPQLIIELSKETGRAPLEVTARAFLTEGSCPVYYTLGADRNGIYKNAKVFWELYGPQEEDYRYLIDWNRQPRIREEGTRTIVDIKFTISQPGKYSLRAATVDLAGRTAVVWKNIIVKD
jgi:hypothetical protein